MNTLLSGASSFTGYWFANSLASAGHRVTAIYTRDAAAEYADQEIRAQRVARLSDVCRQVFGIRFGEPEFLDLVRSQPWDVYCHHAAHVVDYHSRDFDVSAAVQNNTRGLADVLPALRESGCVRLLLTGSVFEGGEGAGSDGLPHFSPYGLSKSLTAEMFRYYAAREGFRLGKFVIPNPFGPLEDPRFCHYLVRCWLAGETPSVRTPLYVRDNIHVSFLAAAYVHFAERLPPQLGFERCHPSGYIESQGAFAERFARELRPRLGLECPVALEHQTDFPEPRIRINTDAVDPHPWGLSESRAWDEVAEYYARRPPAAR